jgi:hypothetical protein
VYNTAGLLEKRHGAAARSGNIKNRKRDENREKS